jgi:CysZ protein
MVPVVVALVLGTGIGALGIWGAWRAADAILSGDSAWAETGRWLITIVFGLVALMVALLLALSLAQPLSGFALDNIVRRQEKELGSTHVWPDQKFFPQLVRSLGVNLTALIVGLPMIAVLTAIELLAPPAAVVTIPLKFVVSALMVAWDFLDYPLGMRGAGVSARIAFVTSNFWAVLLFGSLSALVLLVPGLGLLLLPMGAAGATRMVMETERA